MKIALTVLKWVGFGTSILAIIGGFPTGLATLAVCGLGLFVWIYGTIINALSIKKHLKQQYSVKWGVLQIISLSGIVPGVIMIVATQLEKKQIEKDLAVLDAAVDEAVDSAEAVVNELAE